MFYNIKTIYAQYTPRRLKQTKKKISVKILQIYLFY